MSERTTRTGLRRLWPDSISGQLLVALLACILLLQATNFLVVCTVQSLYISQAEKSRAENLAAYWFLFTVMTPDQRETALGYMADARRPEQLREMIEFLPEAPDWGPPETRQAAALARLVHESLMPGKKSRPSSSPESRNEPNRSTASPRPTCRCWKPPSAFPTARGSR